MQPISSNVVFHVSDLEQAIKFYTQHLGFKVNFKFGDPLFYAGLRFGNVSIHISTSYPYKNNTGHGNIYLIYDEVDTLYEKLLAQNVAFYSHIANREYGMRDFAIKDPDGNQIGIGSASEAQ